MARSKGSRKYPRPRRSRQQNTGEATNGESLLALLKWFLADGGIFAHLKFHGNTRWSPLGLVSLALCWAWSDSRNLTDAFTQAVECCQTILGSSPLNTYQGFMGAMVRWTFPIRGGAVVALASEDGRDRRQVLANRRLGADRF